MVEHGICKNDMVEGRDSLCSRSSLGLSKALSVDHDMSDSEPAHVRDSLSRRSSEFHRSGQVASLDFSKLSMGAHARFDDEFADGRGSLGSRSTGFDTLRDSVSSDRGSLCSRGALLWTDACIEDDVQTGTSASDHEDAMTQCTVRQGQTIARDTLIRRSGLGLSMLSWRSFVCRTHEFGSDPQGMQREIGPLIR